MRNAPPEFSITPPRRIPLAGNEAIDAAMLSRVSHQLEVFAMPFDGTDSPELFRFSGSIGVAKPGWRARLVRSFRDLQEKLPGRSRQAEAERVALNAWRLLIESRELIAAQDGWVQGTYRTQDGRRHCAIGALQTAISGRYGRGAVKAAHDRLLAVAWSRGFDSVERMNDKSSHAEVLSAFDLAIAHGSGSHPA